MAESTLSLSFSDLCRHVCRDLGWTRTAEKSGGTISVTTGTVTLAGATWPSWAAAGTLLYNGTFYTVATRTDSTHIVLDDTSLTGVAGAAYTLFQLTEDEANDLIDVVKTGLRNVYAPLPLDGYTHRWSFMDPITTLTTRAPYSTGTVTIVAGVVTLAGGTFPTWAASGELRIDGVAYPVATYSSGSSITLDDTSIAAAAGTTYELVQQVYDLPDDFGGIIGPLTYRPGTPNTSLEVGLRSETELRRSQRVLDVPTAPRYYAIRPKTYSGGTSQGQRWELLLDVPPDRAYVFTYRYSRSPDTISTANQYPYGGLYMAETYKESCLAAAELMLRDLANGPHKQKFLENLKASIEKDRAEMVPDSLGVDYGQGRLRNGENRFTPGVQITIEV